MSREQIVILVEFIYQQDFTFSEVFQLLKALQAKKKEAARLEELEDPCKL